MHLGYVTTFFLLQKNYIVLDDAGDLMLDPAEVKMTQRPDMKWSEHKKQLEEYAQALHHCPGIDTGCIFLLIIQECQREEGELI